jgi:hypothetical protein
LLIPDNEDKQQSQREELPSTMKKRMSLTILKVNGIKELTRSRKSISTRLINYLNDENKTTQLLKEYEVESSYDML